MLKKPVFITSSPNTKADDTWLALRTLLQPWKWNQVRYAADFNRSLINYLFQDTWSMLGNTEPENTKLFLFDSGRSSLYFLLKTLGVGAGDEVVVPAFTCLAVANPVHWVGATPVYVDADINTFNIDLDLLESRITRNTKAIVVQHTFGKPVDMDRLHKLLRRKRIVVIEDCAHALGGSYKGQKLGTIGDAAFFGFGIDKSISGVRGGAALLDLEKLHTKGINIDAARLNRTYAVVPHHPKKLTWTSLLNPIIWAMASRLYFTGYKSLTLGRLMVRMLYKLRIIGNVVAVDENAGDKPSWMPAKMSPALAILANHQLTKLDAMSEHRSEIARIYSDDLGFEFDEENEVHHKFSMLVSGPEERDLLYEYIKNKAHVIIGDWLRRPLYSKWSSTDVYEALSFDPDEYPIAMEIGETIINLPTVNISPQAAKMLVEEYI